MNQSHLIVIQFFSKELITDMIPTQSIPELPIKAQATQTHITRKVVLSNLMPYVRHGLCAGPACDTFNVFFFLRVHRYFVLCFSYRVSYFQHLPVIQNQHIQHKGHASPLACKLFYTLSGLLLEFGLPVIKII